LLYVAIAYPPIMRYLFFRPQYEVSYNFAAIVIHMKRLHLEQLGRERKRDMHNLISNWQGSKQPIAVLEESLRTLAQDERPKADQVRIRERTDIAFFATYARGSSAARSRAAVTRVDAQFLLDVITELRKQVPGIDDKPDVAGLAMGGFSSAALGGSAALQSLPQQLREQVTKVLALLAPTACQQTLLL